MNGTSVIGGGSPGSAPSPWTIVGQGDFNGDGFADILWRNATTGQLVVWLLSGTSLIGGGSPARRRVPGLSPAPATSTATNPVTCSGTTPAPGRSCSGLERRNDGGPRLARLGGKPVDDRRHRRFQRRRQDRYPLVQHEQRAGIDLAAQRRDRDRRWLAWLRGQSVDGRWHRRLQPRRQQQQRHPLVQRQQRTSGRVAAQRRVADRRRLARLGGKPVTDPGPQQRLRALADLVGASARVALIRF